MTTKVDALLLEFRQRDLGLDKKLSDINTQLKILSRTSKTAAVGIDDMGDAAKKTGRGFQTWQKAAAGVGTALAAIGLARLTGDLFEIATAAEETGSKFDTVFGPEGSEQVTAFLDNFANRAGLAQTEAKELSATLGAVLQGLGQTQAASAGTSVEILRLAADLGSFNNLPTADVIQRIIAGLTGERESLKRLGIVITEVEVQQRALLRTGRRRAAALTQEEKALASLELITEKAGVAVGDLDRTFESTANQARLFFAELRDIREEIAVSLLPAFERLFRFLNENQESFRAFGAGLADVIGAAIEQVDLLIQTFDGLRARAERGQADLSQFIGDPRAFEKARGQVLGVARDLAAARAELEAVSQAVTDLGVDIEDEIDLATLAETDQVLANRFQRARADVEALIRTLNEAIAIQRGIGSVQTTTTGGNVTEETLETAEERNRRLREEKDLRTEINRLIRDTERRALRAAADEAELFRDILDETRGKVLTTTEETEILADATEAVAEFIKEARDLELELAEAAEDAADAQQEQFANLLLSLSQATRGAFQLANAFGIISDEASRAAQSVELIATSALSFVGAIGSGNIGGAISAGVGVIGGIAGLFGGDDEAKRVAAENTRAVQDLTESVEAQTRILTSVSGGSLARVRALAAGGGFRASGEGGLGGLVRDFGQFVTSEEFREAQRVAEEFGITLDGSTESWKALKDAIDALDLASLTDTFAGTLERISAELALFDIDDPVERLRRLRDAFLEFTDLPAELQAGLTGDLSTASGRRQFEEALQRAFGAALSGELDLGALGGLNAAEFRQAILELEGIVDEIAGGRTQGVRRQISITEVQASQLLALDTTRNFLLEEILAALTAPVGPGLAAPATPGVPRSVIVNLQVGPNEITAATAAEAVDDIVELASRRLGQELVENQDLLGVLRS